jgi:hypothetical protein
MENHMSYRITPAMLAAGALALSRCREFSAHTPETTAHSVFVAMLDAAQVTPGKHLRNTFRRSLYFETGVTQSRPPLANPLASYAGLRLASYLWHAWDEKHRLHYFRDTTRADEWIRISDHGWLVPGFHENLARGDYHVHAAQVFMNAKKGWITKP